MRVLNKKLIIVILLLSQFIAGMQKALILIDFCKYHLQTEHQHISVHDCKIGELDLDDSMPTYPGQYTLISDFELLELVVLIQKNMDQLNSTINYQEPLSTTFYHTPWRPPSHG